MAWAALGGEDGAGDSIGGVTTGAVPGGVIG
jgi:hypothetical protein